MQTIIISGNLTSDCEIVKGKDNTDLMKFTVAVNDGRTPGNDKPTFYSCRMRKTGAADYLKKGRYVTLIGTLKVSTNTKDATTYVNLDVWIISLDFAPIKD